MKWQKSILVLIILSASFQICFGQEKPEAVLVDEFPGANCDEFLARTDAFFAALMNEPYSTGYAVIYQDREIPGRSLFYKNLLTRSIYIRKFDKSRLVIIRGEKGNTAEVQFWKVPPGAENPKFTGAEWPESFPDLTKPFVFGGGDDIDICPTFVPELYANFIKTNPTVRGHIVIFDSSKINRQEKAREWLKTFIDDFKVPRERLKVFFAIEKNLPYVEFWIVPKKKK